MGVEWWRVSGGSGSGSGSDGGGGGGGGGGERQKQAGRSRATQEMQPERRRDGLSAEGETSIRRGCGERRKEPVRFLLVSSEGRR